MTPAPGRTFAPFIPATALVMAPVAQAQNAKFPVKPVRMVVGYPAGGPSDILGRLAAQKLTKAQGQQTIVENRPGASGNITAEGMDAVTSTPDEFTQHMQRELLKWAAAVKAAGITAE